MGCLKLHIDTEPTLSVAYRKKGQKPSKIRGSYYPFGLKHKGYNNVINGTNHKYGFGGKEEQDELGLEWQDFGARNYNSSIGRWMNLDPLAERYSNYTPYNYVGNTPLQAIDPDGRAIIFIGGLRMSVGDMDQDMYGNYVSSDYKPSIYRRDVFQYWSTDKNSFGKKASIDNMFKRAYKDNNAFYLSGSSAQRSQANRRHNEGIEKARFFHSYYGYGRGKKSALKEGEAIRIVSHSQGAAHASGFLAQLLTYKDDTGNNLYNVEIIFYLNPHQPGDIVHSNGVTGITYQATTDQVTGANGILSFFGLNGDSAIEDIEGTTNYYGQVFEKGKEGNLLGKRGGHNVTDGQQNLLYIVNEFCSKNPDKCTAITLKEKQE